MQILLIFALIIAALAVVFALQNTALTTVTFLLWTLNGSLALILLSSLIVGAIVGILVSAPTLIRDKLTIRNQKKRIAELEADFSKQKSQIEEAQQQIKGTNQIQSSTDLKETDPGTES